MTSPMKWVFPAILIIALVLGVAYFSSIQNINTNTIDGVEVLGGVLNLGTIRTEIDDNGNVDGQFFDKDELIANLTSEIISVQKNHPYDIKLDYVFFDEDGEVTENDKDIRSVQFRVQYLNDEGEVKATAEKHLAINQYFNPS